MLTDTEKKLLREALEMLLAYYRNEAGRYTASGTAPYRDHCLQQAARIEELRIKVEAGSGTV